MPARRYLMIRGVALIILLTSAYIVWARNFGEGIKGVPFLALLSAAVSFALEWVDHSQAERLKKYLTHSLLSVPLLIAGYVSLLVLLTLNAPVTVLNSADQSLRVNLTALDTPKAEVESGTSSKEEPARFHVWSTPLGRPFRLNAKGYAARTLEVAAPAGVTISTERDLTPEIMLLIRPTLDGMIELRSGGAIHVFRKKDKETEIASIVPERESSVLVGPALVALPRDMIDGWRLELAGKNMADTLRAEILRAWKTPFVANISEAAEELAPKQELRIELRNQANEPIQCGAMTLPETAEIMVDFPLELCHPPLHAEAKTTRRSKP